MTLTISLPIIHIIADQTHTAIYIIHTSISLLFFMFSLSAIFLSRVADIVGPYHVLKFSQISSIIGLVLISFAYLPWMFLLGFFLVGSGTGCYSSIARLLISKHSKDHHSMRKSFSFISMLVVIAPIISAFISLHSTNYSWRLTYWIMSTLELMLLIAVKIMLSESKQNMHTNKRQSLLSGYIFCLKKPYFTLNMVLAGAGIAVFIKLLIGNAHPIIVGQMHMSELFYSRTILFMSISYIIGVYMFRILPKNAPLEYVRVASCIILIVTAVLLPPAQSTTYIIGIMLFYCFVVGLLVPMSSSLALIVIEEHQGAAAALLTFSFAIISALLSVLQTHFNINVVVFTNNTLLTSSVISLIISTLLYVQRKKLTF